MFHVGGNAKRTDWIRSLVLPSEKTMVEQPEYCDILEMKNMLVPV
jgi:hypothetical protein